MQLKYLKSSGAHLNNITEISNFYKTRIQKSKFKEDKIDQLVKLHELTKGVVRE